MRVLASHLHTAVDSAEAVFADMVAKGFTDGLPVVPPTRDAVLGMLEENGMDPGEIVAVLAPTETPCTVEKVAINAVMAGCLPEYLPVVIAGLQATADHGFNLLGIQTTLNPVTPVIVVNGPVRRHLGIDCEADCLSAATRANATIGRAIRLVLVNCGGASFGDVDKAAHGMPGKYTFCFGEHEEGSPWPPLHARRGFDPAQSAVTAFGGQGTASVMAGYTQAQHIADVIGDAMRCYGYNGYRHQWGCPLVLVTARHARFFAEQGWSIERIQSTLFERSCIPRSEIPQERLLVGTPYDQYAPSQPCPPCRAAEDITLVVAGAAEGCEAVYIPSFGHTDPCTIAVGGAGTFSGARQ